VDWLLLREVKSAAFFTGCFPRFGANGRILVAVFDGVAATSTGARKEEELFSFFTADGAFPPWNGLKLVGAVAGRGRC
jgi:hypothetical protein